MEQQFLSDSESQAALAFRAAIAKGQGSSIRTWGVTERINLDDAVLRMRTLVNLYDKYVSEDLQ